MWILDLWKPAIFIAITSPTKQYNIGKGKKKEKTQIPLETAKTFTIVLFQQISREILEIGR